MAKSRKRCCRESCCKVVGKTNRELSFAASWISKSCALRRGVPFALRDGRPQGEMEMEGRRRRSKSFQALCALICSISKHKIHSLTSSPFRTCLPGQSRTPLVIPTMQAACPRWLSPILLGQRSIIRISFQISGLRLSLAWRLFGGRRMPNY